MMRKILLSIPAVLLLLMLNFSTVLAQGSVTYLGKTTWTIHVEESTVADAVDQSFTLTGGISKVGDEFYLFQGYVIGNGGSPYVVSGSGILKDSTLYFTLSESQRHAGASRDSGVLHVELDKTTLSGNMYDIGHDYDNVQLTFNQRYTRGTITLSGGTITLAQAGSLPGTLILLGD